MQNLIGSVWVLYSDSVYVKKHFTELQQYLKKHNNLRFFGALEFKTDYEVAFYTQTVNIKAYHNYKNLFTKKYAYIKDKEHPALLHFLDKGKNHFSLQIVSPYLMVDTQRSTEIEDTENSLAGNKLVKYHILEEYFYIKRYKSLILSQKLSSKPFLLFDIINKKGKNLINNYISEVQNSIKQDDESNGDILTLNCSRAFQLFTGTDDVLLSRLFW